MHGGHFNAQCGDLLVLRLDLLGQRLDLFGLRLVLLALRLDLLGLGLVLLGLRLDGSNQLRHQHVHVQRLLGLYVLQDEIVAVLLLLLLLAMLRLGVLVVPPAMAGAIAVRELERADRCHRLLHHGANVLCKQADGPVAGAVGGGAVLMPAVVGLAVGRRRARHHLDRLHVPEHGRRVDGLDVRDQEIAGKTIPK